MTNQQFKLHSLRQDKIIYATESIAVNTVCTLIFFGYEYIEQIVLPSLTGLVRPSSLIFAVSYTFFMGIGNFNRLRKINSLEKEL